MVHTPGHTPESVSFVLTDRGGGADKPMGIFTGDFVFVGSIGRPDLLEEAAGMVGTAEVRRRATVPLGRAVPDAARLPAGLARSRGRQRLRQGARARSRPRTVGYEKQFNPAVQYHEEEEFVHYILAISRRRRSTSR